MEFFKIFPNFVLSNHNKLVLEGKIIFLKCMPSDKPTKKLGSWLIAIKIMSNNIWYFFSIFVGFHIYLELYFGLKTNRDIINCKSIFNLSDCFWRKKMTAMEKLVLMWQKIQICNFRIGCWIKFAKTIHCFFQHFSFGPPLETMKKKLSK